MKIEREIKELEGKLNQVEEYTNFGNLQREIKELEGQLSEKEN